MFRGLEASAQPSADVVEFIHTDGMGHGVLLPGYLATEGGDHVASGASHARWHDIVMAAMGGENRCTKAVRVQLIAQQSRAGQIGRQGQDAC